MSVFMPKRGSFPATISSVALGNANGDVVCLRENGTPQWYIVASQNYEPNLNTGRVLLARCDAMTRLAWNSSGVNSYAGSTIDQYLTGDYLDLFSAPLRDAIGQTVIRYTPGNGNNTVTTISRAAFLLSLAELDLEYSGVNVEGTALPYASEVQYLFTSGGNQVYGWTRSPRTSNTYQAAAAYGASTSYATAYSVSQQQYFRPCITLPSTTLINPYTNEVLL